jgi:hypothetical protein
MDLYFMFFDNTETRDYHTRFTAACIKIFPSFGVATMRALFIALTFVFSAQSATASITMDFAAAANGNERGYGFGDQITVDGVAVNLFAWNTVGPPLLASPIPNGSLLSNASIFVQGGTLTGSGLQTNGPYAYMDSGNAGLGVGQILNSSLQVTPSNDDNVGIGYVAGVREVVGLQFQSIASIEQFTFRDANHNLLVGAKIDITFDGGANWSQYTTGAGGVVNSFGSVSVDSNDKVALAYVDQQFYLGAVNATLPEPTTFLVWSVLGITSTSLLRRKRNI